MVKVYQIINEQQEADEFDPQEFFTRVVKECSFAVNAMKKTRELLFRGRNSLLSPNQLYYPNPNRQPIDNKPSMQRVVDSVLSAAGFTALRGNSIFCTSNKIQASSYGLVHVIFPLDGFTFTWSQLYKDFYMNFAQNNPNDFCVSGEEKVFPFDSSILEKVQGDERLMRHYLPEMESKLDPDDFKIMKDIADSMTAISNLITNFSSPDFAKRKQQADKYANKIVNYLNSNQQVEWMFTSYMEESRHPYEKYEFYKYFYKNVILTPKIVKDTIKFHEFTNKNFATALKFGNEIAINGPYYAIDYKTFKSEEDHFINAIKRTV